MSARPSTGGIAAALPTASTTPWRRRSTLVADPHRALTLQPRVAPDQRDAPLLEPRQLSRIVELVDDLVAPAQDGGDIELAGHRLAAPGTRRASASAWAGRSRPLDGMQA